MKRMLDTSGYSALRRGHLGVAARVREAEELMVSIIVVGELLFGFRGGERYAHNLADLQSFLREPRVSLRFLTWATADRFGRIAAELRRNGTPIPMNDIWIAAHAQETGAELIALDRHYEKVPGLPLACLDLSGQS